MAGLLLVLSGASCGSDEGAHGGASRETDTPREHDSAPSGQARPDSLVDASTRAALDASRAFFDAGGRPVGDVPRSDVAVDGGTPGLGAAHWDLCAQLAAQAGMALPSEPDVSWARLLCDTVDLDRFTRAPTIPYQARMASSRSPASTVEGAEGWFANDDSGHYVRDDGDEHVLFEAEGPGVITRLWSPNPTGTLRIYIDDATTPAIEGSMHDVFAGKLQTGWGEPLAFEAAEGVSSYFPIPYGAYVRVSAVTDKSLYYQIDHRVYEPGTRVEPYSEAGLRALGPLGQQLRAYVAAPSAFTGLSALPVQEIVLDDTTPERTVALGPVVIRELVVTGFDAAGDRLRTTRLILTVDGERTVDVPLGDLFGTGPGSATFDSLAASVSAGELRLRWPMPVPGDLTVRLESSAGAVGSLKLSLRYSLGEAEGRNLFHARWTGVQMLSSREVVDWTVLHQRGAGWYVGTQLHTGNPTNVWWGEGDEKIFVDGASTPSHFGTGTEDYFGYGWCSTERFARPWIGQTRADGPNNAGRVSLYRWQVSDAIPFASELRFRLEFLHWLQGLLALPVTQDAVAYWYGAPGAEPQAPVLPTSAFVVPPLELVTTPITLDTQSCRL